MVEIEPLQPSKIRTSAPGSKRKLFFVNVCIPIITIVFMLLSAIIIIIRQSIMNSDFLELIAEKIQEKLYVHFGIFEKEALCDQISEETTYICTNISSQQFERYNAWLEYMCK